MTMDEIIRLMVGRELTNQFPPKTNKPGDVALEVENLTAQYSLLRDVSFKVRRGEIVGLAGLDGSGRTETLENIFGIATRKSGTIPNWTVRFAQTATHVNLSRTVSPF